MNEDFLTPSEAYQRFAELHQKTEVDYLTLEEEEELENLAYLLAEQTFDFPFDW